MKFANTNEHQSVHWGNKLPTAIVKYTCAASLKGSKCENSVTGSFMFWILKSFKLIRSDEVEPVEKSFFKEHINSIYVYDFNEAQILFDRSSSLS